MNHCDHSKIFLTRVLPLSLTAAATSGFIGTGAAQASLLGDEVQLNIEFQGDSLTLDTNDILPGTTTTVEADGIVFTDPLTPINPAELEFLSASLAVGDSGLSTSFSQSFFNLEDNLIEGSLFASWDLFSNELAPLNWTYTLNDLDWVDFPTGGIEDISFTFLDGSASGTVIGCIGQSLSDCSDGGVGASAVGLGDGGFSAAANPFTVLADTLDLSAFLSTSFSDDSLTLALDINPLFPIPSNFDPDFIVGSASGSAAANFQIELLVDHSDNPGGGGNPGGGSNPPTSVPEPLGIGG